MTTDDKNHLLHAPGRQNPPAKQTSPPRHFLSFYGAKIGVIDPNGSGKSTLLRIMAGVDQNTSAKSASRPASPSATCRKNRTSTIAKPSAIVEEAVQTTVDLLREYGEINLKFAEPMTDDKMMALIDRQGRVQNELDRVDAWNLDSRLELAMDALRCPPGDTSISVLSGGERRRVALVACCSKTGHPPA